MELLAAIEQRRPLSQMSETEQAQAVTVRSWFRQQLLGLPTHNQDRVQDGDGTMNLDYSVYPDVNLPQELSTLEDKADYVARVCNAWDFGITPTRETFELFANWKEVFDKFVVPHSPAYAAFRYYYGWRQFEDSILEAPWEKFDRMNGRRLPDPCEHLI